MSLVIAVDVSRKCQDSSPRLMILSVPQATQSGHRDSGGRLVDVTGTVTFGAVATTLSGYRPDDRVIRRFISRPSGSWAPYANARELNSAYSRA